MLAFRCTRCRKDHGELPLSYTIGMPDLCFGIPVHEQDTRVILGDDTCAVDGRHFFIRGNIVLRVVDCDDPFVWSVWTSLARRDFKRALAKWMRDSRTSAPPYRGTLGTDLPCYPPTRGLPATLEMQPVGMRPVIRLDDCDHPLARAQREGIDWGEVQRIAEYVIHGPLPGA